MRGCSRGRAPEHQRKMPCGVPRRLAPGSSSPMAGASHDNSIGSPKSTPSRVASGATCVQRSYVSYVNDTSERVPSRLKSPLWPALSSPILRGVSSPSGRSAAPALAPGRSGGCGRPTRDTLGAARPPAGAAGGCRWRVPGGALPGVGCKSAFRFPIGDRRFASSRAGMRHCNSLWSTAC